MLNLLKRITSNNKAPAEDHKQIEYEVPDTALVNYLQYYLDLKSPGYAVLVTGQWGIGKTYQVKQVIPETKRYLVSLYGLDSVNSIHDAVLASSLPSLDAGEFISTISDVGKAIGDKFALAGFANNLWKVILRQRLKPDRVIVFDDLERSPLWANKKSELLGAINHYVEHLGFRVVVICHDERIAEEIVELKEKTFGHTVQAVPQTTAAFNTFISDIVKQEEKAFITEMRSVIEDIWSQSGQSSLRILKHVLNDIARLRGVLNERHLKNQEAIEHLLRFFCALDIEVRAGNLNRDSVINRLQRHVAELAHRAAPAEEKPFHTIISRYPSCDLTGKVLSDEIVTETLIEGKFNAQLIAAWLDQTPYFIEASVAEPWLVVMKFDDIDDATLNEGIARMEAQFEERSVTNMGEFLHIVSLRLLMAEQGASGRSVEQETSLCMQYIDDLLAEGKMPPKSLKHDPFERVKGYGGYSYWVPDTASTNFETVCKHIDHAQQLALEATYPDHAEKVLLLLKEDPSSLFQIISMTNSGKDTLANIPILSHIPAQSFVDAWLSGPRNEWRQTTMALDNRYEYGQLDRNLCDERPWLIKVAKEIDARINVSKGLDSFRLKRIRPKIFDKVTEH